MNKPLEIFALVQKAISLAIAAVKPTALHAIPFVLAAGLYGANEALGGTIGLIALVCVFAALMWYSLKIYQNMMNVETGTLVSLAHANIAAAIAQFFIAFFILFFIGIFGVMMLHLSGLVDLAGDPTSAEMADAQAALYSTPYGGALIIVSVLGALVIAFVALRLVLVGPASVAAGKARVFRTWRWTEARALRLGLASIATHLLPFICALGISLLIQPNDALPTVIWKQIMTGAVSAAAFIPFMLLSHGLAVAAHQRLAQPE